ncbi:MAG TPA: major capsid protein, partial [Tenuifilaceae bacterium]|nr:major capsid protein [Tenuifilaceae bacterium]
PVINGQSDDAINTGLMGVGSLADFFDVPVQMIGNGSYPMIPISQLPFRAYQRIYNEYYRDQNLEPEIEIPQDSGYLGWDELVNGDLLKLRKRAWEKDYFTSALPFAQRGDEVLLPLQGDAPVTGLPRFKNIDGFTASSSQPTHWSNSQHLTASRDGVEGRKELKVVDGLTADLSEASATTISELRRAFALQRWLEKMARGGSRYVEQMLYMFGVRSSDARLQRSVYLGGGKLPIQISEVLQTSQTEISPQGNMSGHGFTAGITNGFKKYFEEHGLVIGILSVIPRTGYMQGMPKLLTKTDRFDYYWPDFAHIGEQEVKKHELYYDPSLSTNNDTFGYQPRYAEYRYKFDKVNGEMRTSLKQWHMANDYSAQPSLNNTFVKANPTTRIFAVEHPQWHKLIVDIYFDFKAIRPVAKHGEPI